MFESIKMSKSFLEYAQGLPPEERPAFAMSLRQHIVEQKARLSDPQHPAPDHGIIADSIEEARIALDYLENGIFQSSVNPPVHEDNPPAHSSNAPPVGLQTRFA